MKIVAFLPCRSGSVRIPDKNTRAFTGAGQSLLDVKLAQLGQARRIDEIVVSSNDPVVLEAATRFASSAPKPVRVDTRPDHLCTSETTTDAVIRYVPTIIASDHILWTHVTSPFVDSAVYDHIVEEYGRALDSGHDSLMTGTKIQTFLYSTEGPVNFDRAIEKWPRTQTLPIWWEINSAAFLVARDLCERLGDRIGERPFIAELDHETSFDIDTMSQFRMGTKLWSIRND